MSLQSPPIDSRTQDDILAQVQALAPFYTPEWDATQQTGAGAALMEIFADLVDGLIQRLNQVPNNNLIAFLNMLGVQLLPAQPALVPLTFSLSSGATQSAPIPARSQAAANPPGGNPIVFETQAAFLATPASLQAVLSVVPEVQGPTPSGDLILNNLADLQSGKPTRLFNPAVTNLQAHILYLGDSNLFNLTGGGTISLQLNGSAQALQGAAWTWIGANGSWQPFTAGLDNFGNLTLSQNQPGAIQQATVNGIKSRWIRAVVQAPKESGLAQVSLTTIKVSPAPPATLLPDAAFANDIPLPVPPLPTPPTPTLTPPTLVPPTLTLRPPIVEMLARQNLTLGMPTLPTRTLPTLTLPTLTVVSPTLTLPTLTLPTPTLPTPTLPTPTPPQPAPLLPFGTLPRQGDAFYIASQEAFSKPDGNVTLSFNFVAWPPPATPTAATDTGAQPPTPSPNLSWEYWNGTGWTVLKNVAGAAVALLTSGNVTFTVPSDLAQTAIGGQSSFWIRVRIASGDYGQVLYTPGQLPDTSGVLYPRISSLTLSYTLAPQAPASVVTFNNGGYQVQTSNPDGSFQSFQPFVPLDDASQALYLGFSQAPLNGPISIFFDLADQAYPDAKPRLEWQYYSKASGQSTGQWNRLAIVDGTQGLTTGGTIQFLGPADFAPLSRYGNNNLYWIRAVDVDDGFEQPASPSSAPSIRLRLPLPVLLGLRKLLVTSGSNLPDQVSLSPVPCDQQTTFTAPFAGGSAKISPAPLINGIYLNTAWAIQAETITSEILGSSDASQNQQYQLTKFPVVSQQIEVDEFGALFASERNALAANKSVTTEQVTDDKGNVIQFWVVWMPVDNLSTAGPTDRVYAIDPTFGTIQFGDGVTGKVPPVGFNNIRATYQFGGGSAGNVDVGAITTLRTTIPLVGSVNNPVAAGGGSDTETPDAALARGTESVKNRGRAVSAEDYEWITFAASRDVARVLVLPDFNDQGQPEANWVTVLIVPGTSDPRPYPSFELQQTVENYLLARAPAVTTALGHVQVTGPTYVDVDVSADLYPVSIDLAPQLETVAVSDLQAFLHPLTGGPLGQGWDFGALPCLSDFYGLLGAIAGVDHMENLSMNIYVVNPAGDPLGAPLTIDQSHPFNGSLPAYALIASGNHTITVKLPNSGSSS